MRIQLIRSGGFSKEKRVVNLDTSDYSSWVAEDIKGLVNGSDFFNLPESLPKVDWTKDTFEYRITITEESRSHTVEATTSTAPEGLLRLIRRIEQGVITSI